MKSFFGIALTLFAATAYAQAANTATVSFSPPTTMADGSAIPNPALLSYGIYLGEQGAAKTKVTISNGSPVPITSGLTTGKTYCVQVTAIIGGLESAMSNEACKSFIPPSPVVIKVY
jgi:ABC-type nitrate/sulfonate/bicarbonate transport system substrate-binding protein